MSPLLSSKLEPAEVPSCGQQVSWGPRYVLTQLPLSWSEYLLWFHLDMMEITSDFISGGGLARSKVKLLPHLILHKHKLLWGEDALWEL